MKQQPPRGAQARYTRSLTSAFTRRKVMLRGAVEQLAPLWAGDMEQLAAALDRLQLGAPLVVDHAELEQFALSAQASHGHMACRLMQQQHLGPGHGPSRRGGAGPVPPPDLGRVSTTSSTRLTDLKRKHRISGTSIYVDGVMFPAA